MDMICWCSNTFINEECQRELENKIDALLKGPLKDKSEYAQEKAIKSFSEGLGYLEKLLLKQEDIDFDVINKNPILLSDEKLKQSIFKKYKNVQDKMMVEISRQFRHFITFL